MSNFYGCRICGQAYTASQIEEDGVNNPCCRSNLTEIGEADFEANQSTDKSMLEETKQSPPKAPEEFSGIEKREGV